MTIEIAARSYFVETYFNDHFIFLVLPCAYVFRWKCSMEVSMHAFHSARWSLDACQSHRIYYEILVAYFGSSRDDLLHYYLIYIYVGYD